MSERIAVYISSPYTKPDPGANVHRAAKFWHRLRHAGFVPYSPIVDTHTLHLISPLSYEEWMAHDLAMLSRFDVVARLQGFSAGADRECAKADELGIPVVTGDDDDETFRQLVAFRKRFVAAGAAAADACADQRCTGCGYPRGAVHAPDCPDVVQWTPGSRVLRDDCEV